MTGSNDEHDRVGYGRPPKKTRFKKGESGNLKGRPKGAKARRSARTTVERVLSQKVSAVVDGKMKRVPLSELVVLQLARAAAQGNVGAQRELLRCINTSERNRDDPATEPDPGSGNEISTDWSAFIKSIGASGAFEELCFALGIAFFGDDGEIYLHPEIAAAATALNHTETWKLDFPLHTRLATPELMARGLTSKDHAALSRYERLLRDALDPDNSSS